MKRRDLLTANEHLHPDFAGRIKRRNSDERLDSSAASTEHEEQDALVYIHNVRPEDTLAGISIKFNCQVPVLRKANRMWPNDSVQIKKTIVIPVDACGVKGRPVPAPDQADENLLLDDFGDGRNASINQSGNSGPSQNGWPPGSSKLSDPPHPPPSAHSNSEHEPPWKHDSWVLLPNDITPIEIGRMPRRALGYFPPARRKSLAFSDASTPTASLDLSRSSTSTYQSHSQPFSSSQLRPRSANNTTPRPSQQRNRSLSNFSLHGPGGVGTLGKNVRSPGPAQDGLNKLFASHLPNVAPPPDQEYFTAWLPSLLDPEGSVQFGNSGARTPSGGVGLELENVGGAIESWMRKMASRASTIIAEQTANANANKRSATPVIGTVGGDLGDLIELRDDAFEVGDGTNDADSRGIWSRDSSAAPPKGQFQVSRADNAASGSGAVSGVVRERGRRNESRKRD
jgi:LysM repeat protein